MSASILPIVNEQHRPDSISSLMRNEAVLQAFNFIKISASEFTDEQIRICEIPAPPFQEELRGQYIANRFRELGLSDVHFDTEGNVIGYYHSDLEGQLLVVSAHLDTVFPAETNCKIRRFSNKILAPGIGDNASGLAAMIAMIRLLNVGNFKTRGSIAFVATVGEEGEGDLRGSKHLFYTGTLSGKISHFISFDGPGNDFITHQALGSRRYRIAFEGPGGHSWTDFGTVNPAHAIGRAIARLAEFPVPHNPRTTYNVGRIEAGTSVNVIPERASFDVDIRSTDEYELARVEDFLLSSVNQAMRSENSLRAGAHHSLKLDVHLIGHRPSGETSEHTPLVQTAIEATKAVGVQPWLNCASTDANIPISLGIQAITIGAGGRGGDAHRLTEWYEPTGRDLGYQRALLLILATVGLR